MDCYCYFKSNLYKLFGDAGVYMNNCCCCDTPLLRHVANRGIFWFCSHCRVEMPNLSATHNLVKQNDRLDKMLANSILSLRKS